MGSDNLGFSQASYSRLPLKDVLAENLPFILTTDTGVSGIEHARLHINSNSEKHICDLSFSPKPAIE